MTKKEYILLILLWLENDWPLARWLKILLMNTDIQDEIIEWLFVIFKEHIMLLKDDYLKSKLMKSMSALEKIRKKELFEKEQESKEVYDIESELAMI